MCDDEVYCLAGPVAWREIDGQWVAYLANAGAMAQLDELAVSLLTLLEESSGSMSSLVGRLEAESNLPSDSGTIEAVKSAMRFLLDGRFVRLIGGEPAW